MNPVVVIGRRARLALAGAALLLAASGARASCCIFEDPLLAVGDLAARGGTLRLALETELLSSGSTMPSSDGLGTMDETIQLSTLRTVAVFSPVERLNLVAVAPFVRRAWRAESGSMPAETATLTGIGDVDLGARYALWRQVAFVPDDERVAVTRVQALAVSLGTGLPTGENSATRGGVRLPEHAQIGTGAWAPYAGLAYQLQRDPWAVSASTTARVRTENAAGYRFSPAFLGGADVQHEVVTRLSLGFGAEVRWAAVDREHGTVVANTGGLVVSAAPSASLGIAQGLRLRVRAQLPVLERLHGDQRVGPGVVAGVSWDAR